MPRNILCNLYFEGTAWHCVKMHFQSTLHLDALFVNVLFALSEWILHCISFFNNSFIGFDQVVIILDVNLVEIQVNLIIVDMALIGWGAFGRLLCFKMTQSSACLILNQPRKVICHTTSHLSSLALFSHQVQILNLYRQNSNQNSTLLPELPHSGLCSSSVHYALLIYNASCCLLTMPLSHVDDFHLGTLGGGTNYLPPFNLSNLGLALQFEYSNTCSIVI